MSEHESCTYVDHETGAPCLKARHDDSSGHMCMVGWDGQPMTKIVPLDKWITVHKRGDKETISATAKVPYYASSMLDGVIVKNDCQPHCATKRAPVGHLLVGRFACDCKP